MTASSGKRLVAFAWPAEVVRVHDGDTIFGIVDRGFYEYLGSRERPYPIRLAGVAARALTRAGGKDARDNLAGLLPPGTQLGLYTISPYKYNPGLVAKVVYYDLATQQLVNLNQKLIDEGWAVPWDGKGRQPEPDWPRITEKVEIHDHLTGEE